VNEDQEHLSKIIDQCSKFPYSYQTQTGLDLVSKAQFLLQQYDYQFWTDGRRIVACETGNSQQEKDEESLSTWDDWNSPRSSFDSLHLDEIEEMNLKNMQEEEPDVTTQSRCNKQSMQRGLMMTQAMMEATITAVQKYPDADKKVSQRGSTITSMMEQVCETWKQP
ncbi:hypothetical protein Gotur_026463, partial [Gossypium turneri]